MQTAQISQIILATLAYFDLFDYPLTYPELYRYLWRSPQTTLAEVMQVTRQIPQVLERDGFVMLQDRTTLPSIRQQRYVESELKWNKRRWFIRLLSYLPGVEAIFLTNTFAYHNVKVDSDIDVLIVTRPNAIWATRFYTTAVAKLFGVRPRPNRTKDAICLSFYVTSTGLTHLEDLRRDNDDALEAYWLAQAMPVYDPHGYAEQMADGRWLKTVLPNNQPVTQHANRSIEHTWLHVLCHGIGRLLLWEKILKAIQWWVMPKKLKQLSGPLPAGIVILSNELLKFHTNDPRPQLTQDWQVRIQKYS